MEIKTKTEYTAERLIRFNTAHVLKNKLRWILYITATIVFLALFIFSIVRGASTGDYGRIALYGGVFVIIVALDIYTVIASFVLPRSKIKNAPIVGATLSVTFREDGIVVLGHSKGTDSNSAHSYLSLQTVIKKGNDMYLYVNKSNAYIVDLSQLNEEEINQIKQRITSKVKDTKWK